jgi:hypothetical protein
MMMAYEREDALPVKIQITVQPPMTAPPLQNSALHTISGLPGQISSLPGQISSLPVFRHTSPLTSDMGQGGRALRRVEGRWAGPQ